jgi:hypothetical protein
MDPKIFSSATGEDAQDAFQQWQEANRGGFYINLKTKSQGMLHKVGCGHVGQPGDWDPDFGDVARRAKVCHRDRAALLSWAQREGVVVNHCADCKP